MKKKERMAHALLEHYLMGAGDGDVRCRHCGQIKSAGAAQEHKEGCVMLIATEIIGVPAIVYPAEKKK